MYLTIFAMSFYYSSLECLHASGPNVMAASIKFRSLKTAVFKQIIHLFLSLSHSSCQAFELGGFPFSTYAILMLSGPPLPLFACNTQCKCIRALTPLTPPRCLRTKWKAPSLFL